MKKIILLVGLLVYSNGWTDVTLNDAVELTCDINPGPGAEYIKFHLHIEKDPLKSWYKLPNEEDYEGDRRKMGHAKRMFFFGVKKKKKLNLINKPIYQIDLVELLENAITVRIWPATGRLNYSILSIDRNSGFLSVQTNVRGCSDFGGFCDDKLFGECSKGLLKPKEPIKKERKF